jgi:hypothetical protein
MKAWVGLTLTVSIVVAAVGAPWIAGHDPLVADFASGLKPPGTPGHPLGTDQLGRDLLARVLHGARLARGITLLTQGTAYDVVTHQYLNPSDWQDRPLKSFTVRDHVHVVQSEAPTDGVEWVFTQGLSKFGMDELETFAARGLPLGLVMETLLAIAEALMGRAHPITVGTELTLTELALSI